MARKIIFIVILLSCMIARAETHQNESNQIKKDNPYDDQLGKRPTGFEKVLSNDYINDVDRIVRETPFYGGSLVDPTLGKSQYDESIPWRDLMNESLNDIRAERRNEQIKSVLTIILTVGILFFVVFFLIKTSKKDPHKNDLL